MRSDDAPDASDPSPTNPPNQPLNDLISQGIISIEDAERLFHIFIHRVDTFMYLVGSGKYRDLESMRRSSAILTAAVCAVAALHDHSSNHLYGPCTREFRRLVAASMFERRISRDCMRAMCIGAYWLHDIAWTLSGCAIRRATEFNLNRNYKLVIEENNEEAMDCMRIWYILYICDHHLSVMYGRQSIIREDASILEWEQLLKSSAVTESDRRMVSQMALLIIMSNIRELFGPDNGEPVPRAFVPQLLSFSRQIDQWMGHWTTELASKYYSTLCDSSLSLTVVGLHQSIGNFPAKGVILHHHFAKLHLHSHVFRGLKGGDVPMYFRESAAAAVSASTAIIDMLLTDPDVRESLVGIPHYIHSMIAFACVFLLKVAMQHSGQYIEDSFVLDLTARVVRQLRLTSASKYHLSHLMADGLEKMAAAKIQSPSASHTQPLMLNGQGPPSVSHPNNNTMAPMSNDNGNIYPNGVIANGFEEDFNLATAQFLHFDSGSLDFNFGLLG